MRRLRTITLVGAVLPRGREVLLGRHEAVELGADRVDTPLALLGHRHGPRGGQVSPRDVDERDRVVLNVGGSSLRDPLCPGLLLGAVGDQPFQRPGLLGEGGPGRPPRLKEILLSGDEEPALARLEVDDKPLEPVGDDEHLGGVRRARLRRAQVGDQGEQDREDGADDQREQGAREDHATG